MRYRGEKSCRNAKLKKNPTDRKTPSVLYSKVNPKDNEPSEKSAKRKSYIKLK